MDDKRLLESAQAFAEQIIEFVSQRKCITDEITNNEKEDIQVSNLQTKENEANLFSPELLEKYNDLLIARINNEFDKDSISYIKEKVFSFETKFNETYEQKFNILSARVSKLYEEICKNESFKHSYDDNFKALDEKVNKIEEIVSGKIKTEISMIEAISELNKKYESIKKQNEVLSSIVSDKNLYDDKFESINQNIEKLILDRNSSDLSEKNKVIAALEKEKETLVQTIEDKTKENDLLKTKVVELEDKSQDFASFTVIIEILKKLDSLNTENKEYLYKLCGSSEWTAIISLGREEDKLIQLWSYLRDLAVQGKCFDDVPVLSEYFDYCIKVYNSTKPESSRYELEKVEIGNEFNSGLYIKTAKSSQVGVVKDVLTNGYSLNGNRKYKAIVIVC